jgi:hypothetical protein
VKAYRASAGSVTLSAREPVLVGEFSAEARKAGEPAPVRITGRFRGITVGPCGG